MLVFEEAVRASLELARAVGPVEDQAEEQSFEAGEEGGHAEVDVVVGHAARGGEELAVEEGEDDLCV